jgi:hypothetical protein
MQVEAIDISSRPSDIPLSKWLKLKVPYTVINSFKDMNGVLLFQLEEIDLVSLGTSYKGFASSRFRVLEDSGMDELVEELINELEMV